MREKEEKVEELTVRLVGFLKIDAKGRSAIRAAANPLRLLLLSIAAAILVVSTSYAKPELIRNTLQWGLDHFLRY